MMISWVGNGIYCVTTMLVINTPTVDTDTDTTTVVNQLLFTSDGNVVSNSPLSVSTSTCDDCVQLPPNFTPSQMRVGRVYPLPNDVIVTLTAQPSSTYGQITIQDPNDSSNNSVTSFNHVASGLILQAQFALGDFDKDGFQDIFFINHSGADPTADVSIITYKADLNNPSAGLTGEHLVTLTSAYTPQGVPVVGDFNGDGALDVAWPGATPQKGAALKIYFASICPAAGVVVLGQTCGSALDIIHSPQSIDTGYTVQKETEYPPAPQPAFFAPLVSLAADNFDGSVDLTTGVADAELLMALGDVGKQQSILTAYDFDSTLTPTVGPNQLPFSSTISYSLSVLASGRLDWSDQHAQAVFASTVYDSSNQGYGNPFISVITFDDDLNMTSHPNNQTSLIGLEAVGVAVGRFDPANTSTGTDFNQQFAVLFNTQPTADPPTFSMGLYTAEKSSSFTPKESSGFSLTNPSPNIPLNVIWASPLQVGDLQGRSLLLGAPQKVTITGYHQPDIVLGIPPMHVDYIQAVDQSSGALDPSPSVLNLTVDPTGFNTQYTFSSTTKTNATRVNTTSYAFSTQESAGAKISYGVPDVAGVSADLKVAAKQTHDANVSNNYSYGTGTSDSVSATTGFADHVYFTSTTQNIYYYPVIGQTVCPAANPSCSDSEKLPLHVQFSGPDTINISDTDATTQEWYQPPWEPGNVFSYSWNLSLLQQAFPNFTPLTTDPAPERATDTSSTAYTTEWADSQGASKSSGSVNSQSQDLSLSVDANASLEGFGVDVSAGFDVNASQSVSTLNTSKQTLDASTGITINKPGFGSTVANNYQYYFGGYVFGQKTPTGSAQTISLGTDIQTSGPLTVGFVADPEDESGRQEPWWAQVYQLPDVGLSHPERWNWSASTQSVKFYTAGTNTSTPQDEPFYRIKGLFITPSTQLSDGKVTCPLPTPTSTPTGPQLTTAPAGEKLCLYARVFNYSLADMPTGSHVHVRFYGQAYESSSLVGNSFQIGDDVMIDPIRGFNSAATPQPPNWALAKQLFDTADYGDTNLIFWVLVWMTDSTGSLGSELNGHGLREDPSSLTFT
jgi:hypothetical protein